MRDYLLFIDTETSGLPRKWNVPYSKDKNWPHAVQMAWVVYTRNGDMVKQENHYISDCDFNIEPSAVKVHGITRKFLNDNGVPRVEVLSKLEEDLNQYQPIVAGHFMELDYHVIGADFSRIGKDNPLKNFPVFCTMLATRHLVRNPAVNYLRLNELYTMLFGKKFHFQHNALADAQATAECFFLLIRRNDINEEQLEKQSRITIEGYEVTDNRSRTLQLILLIVLIILIIAWIWVVKRSF
ncbi:3'-5' exonuclease [Pedobacter sp. BS3]|uniref:3'-5' exonuclease n=1 Tax=Pedobacter sp. BS3 TaxID=2567937 RepID=UPI0016592746|nr:3'-5' exonuclease [Pedobacter sp. BS3]